MVRIPLRKAGVENYVRGQAALSLVLLVGGTVVLIGATLTFLVISFINTTFGYQAANKALGVALAGANDALWQLSKDRNFARTSLSECAYDVYVGADKAAVGVLRKGSSCGNGPSDLNQVWIDSEATYLGRTRKIEMVASVDEVTGRVDVISIRQRVTVQGGGCRGVCP